ncbi:hypothetical protein AB833_01495 [Chromatiales bacterium (ex Bugula neritina AB1)]|nr:hypothetical protein AB833_01495 [Chromatiales bacterium (ex Bugula neritina AB1)]
MAIQRQGEIALKSVFGNYVESDSGDWEFLDVAISMSSDSAESDWRKNTLCAEFIGKYMLNTIESHKQTSNSESRDIKDAINYIANELFENAVKFTTVVSNKAICFRVENVGNVVRFYVRNSIDKARIESFQKLISELLSGDPAEMYFQRIEANEESESGNTSGLGYLSIMNDYDAGLAWKFDISSGADTPSYVTTMIQIDV